MAEKPEDLSLPVSIVSRIINDAIPANTNVSQETRKAIAKAASVFVLYATANAAGIAAKHNRKTTTANDVLEAIVDMEFPQFSEPLRKSLLHYQEVMKQKKKNNPGPSGSKKADADQPAEPEKEKPSTSKASKASKSNSKSSSKSSPSSNKSSSKTNSSAMDVVDLSSDDE